MEDSDIDRRWRALAERALRGAPLEGLTHTTPDGIELQPFRGPVPPVYSGRASSGRWSVVQRVDDAQGAAAQALLDLHNGADALELVFAGSGEPGGLSVRNVEALGEVLDGVHLEHCALHLRGGGIGALAMVLALAERRGEQPLAIHGGVDPWGALFANGASAGTDEAAEALAGADLAAIGEGTVVLADGRPAAEAGASPVAEIAFALASLSAALRAAEARNVAPADAMGRIAIGLSADQDQFATIAKLRAARRLHALIARACGAQGAPARVHATTKARMLSGSDPHTNLLRLTIAAFSAGVGGADALFVHPFDGSASPFARRMSRNIQSLLLEEAHVDMLADPAAGAGSIEALTDNMAKAAWKLFQQVEAEHEARIASGDWRERIAASATEEATTVYRGERHIIGVTKHPPHVLAEPRFVPPRPSGAPEGDLRPLVTLKEDAQDGASFAALAPPLVVEAPATPPERLAARFEEASDAA